MYMQIKCPIQDQNYESKEEKYQHKMIGIKIKTFFRNMLLWVWLSLPQETFRKNWNDRGINPVASSNIKKKNIDMSNSHQFLCNITVMRKRLDQGNEKYFETSWKKTERQIYKVLNFSNNEVWWNFLLQGSNILEAILACLTSRQLGKL